MKKIKTVLIALLVVLLLALLVSASTEEKYLTIKDTDYLVSNTNCSFVHMIENECLLFVPGDAGEIGIDVCVPNECLGKNVTIVSLKNYEAQKATFREDMELQVDEQAKLISQLELQGPQYLSQLDPYELMFITSLIFLIITIIITFPSVVKNIFPIAMLYAVISLGLGIDYHTSIINYLQEDFQRSTFLFVLLIGGVLLMKTERLAYRIRFMLGDFFHSIFNTFSFDDETPEIAIPTSKRFDPLSFGNLRDFPQISKENYEKDFETEREEEIIKERRVEINEEEPTKDGF